MTTYERRHYRECACPHCDCTWWHLIVAVNDAPIVLVCDICGAQWLAIDE